ncbi:MAG: CHAT domain-containing protein [Gemmataceae bacterium]
MRFVAVSFTALYVAWDRPAKARQWAETTVRLTLEILDHKMPLLAECDQCRLLRSEADWQDVLRVGWRPGAEPEAVRASAEWVLNYKGLNLEMLTDRARLARDAASAAPLEKLERLGRLRERIATARCACAMDNDEGRRMLAEEATLSKELGRLIYKDGRTTVWVKLDDVRKSLPADGVLVDILRIEDRDLVTHKSRGHRYVAWVVPPSGPVRVIDLGPAGRIDAAVRSARQAVAEGADADRGVRGLADLEDDARERLANAAAVLRPLLTHLDGATRWVLSPDAALWLLPWNALPDGKGYAVERRVIQHVVTARDLVRRPTAGPTSAAVVMGFPDYDHRRGELAAATRFDRFRAERGAPTRSGSLGERRFAPLPGTRDEVSAIAPLVRAYAGGRAAVHTGPAAAERTFKALVRPRLVVISTHGVFLNPSDAADEPTSTGVPDLSVLAVRAPAGSRLFVDGVERPGREFRQTVRPLEVKRTRVEVRFEDGRTETRTVNRLGGRRDVLRFGPPPLPGHLENPLLRCGLILAGANRRHELPPESADDGILTGLEIVGTDLRGTELVVLSACETGVGDPRSAEGVVGLRQAFQLAGARQVVSSLWKVPDDETKDLMVRFWSGLEKDADPAAALTAAQRAMIGRQREAGRPTHPYHWAAFGVTGARR